MNIKDLKHTLSEAIQKVEDVYNSYSSHKAELDDFAKRLEVKHMELINDDQKLSVLIDKYEEVDSLEEVRKNTEITIKAAEGRMSDVNDERAKFEKYKSEIVAKIDKANNILKNRERTLEQGNDNLQKSIADFNETKKKYVMTEGEASF